MPGRAKDSFLGRSKGRADERVGRSSDDELALVTVLEYVESSIPAGMTIDEYRRSRRRPKPRRRRRLLLLRARRR
jgi:hypothetical protein